MQRILVSILVLLAIGARGADFVITVSIDGMGSSFMPALIDAGKLPFLKQIAAQGAGTMNARADYDITVTLPNHVTMVTSSPIKGARGHTWTSNTNPAKGTTLHSNKGTYVAGAFDVAHDNGLRTGLWSTKTKFSLFKISYDAEHGAPDTTGPDNGRNKLDVFTYVKSAPELTAQFIANMTTNPCNYAFVHLGDTDAAGHEHGWGSPEYMAALTSMDSCLGLIMKSMTDNPELKNRSTLIVTADHGGHGIGHGDATDPLNYTIPFYVWGAGVTPGDLYTFNAGVRSSPGNGRPDYAAQPQPIRNGDAGNLALTLLGLGSIPGSSIDAQHDLLIAPQPSTTTPHAAP